MILEILISTINRGDLSFLNEMFDDDYSHVKILIINQTSKDKVLESNRGNIRVINSFEYGISKSRNLAIKNAVGDICLISDDDVKFVKDFDKKIEQAFIRNTTVSLIKFKIDTFCGRDYKIYPEKSKKISSKKYIISTSSVEIAFRRKDILNNNILFNTLFGLGSYFTSGEEYLFLKKTLKKGLNIRFENIYIVKHAFERSTSNIASDNYIKSKAAIYFVDYKNVSYLFLLKYILFLIRKGIIQFKDFKSKYMVGVEAIKEYKSLIN